MVHKKDWKTKPMPAQTAQFVLEREFTENEMLRIKEGLLPASMEDRWFLYYENDTLFVHRSWTGTCIYLVHFGNQNKVLVTVNRDPEQYRVTDNMQDREFLNGLLDYLIESRL